MPKSVDIARLHVIGHDQEHALGSLHGAILLSLTLSTTARHESARMFFIFWAACKATACRAQGLTLKSV